MLYSIENEHLRVQILSLGAEIVSIFSKDTSTEYIWYGDEKYWSGHSPIMFPICGRLCEGKYTYRGKEYSMPNHGFTRKTEMTPCEINDDSITFKMVADSETLSQYPFDFVFKATYTLDGKALKMKLTVENENEEELIFAVGAHPAFNVPLSKDEKFEDYYIELENECNAYRVDFSEACLCTKNDKPYNENGTKTLPLDHSLFDNDAIFLYNVPCVAYLKSNKGQRGLKMTYEKMKYLGIWHKPKSDAPYVCIEPWLSIPAKDGIVDDLSTKEDMVKLPKGEKYENEIIIEIF